MSSDILNIKAYTPAGLAFEDRTSAVSIPSSEGEIGVLAHHTKYVGLLGTGIMQFVSQDGSTKRVVVSGGFCKFDNDTLIILADSIDLAESVPQNYSSERDNLQKTLQTVIAGEPEWQYAKQALDRIESIEKLLAQ